MPFMKNKRTGEVIEVDATGRPVSRPPADPTFPYKGPKAAVDLEGAQLGNQKTAADIARDMEKIKIDRDRLDQENTKIQAGLTKDGIVPDGQGGFMRDPGAKPEITPAQRSQTLTDYQASLDLAPIIKDLEAKFKAGPGATKGLRSIADYLPLPANREFDSAANKLRGFVKRAQGFTGGEGNTAAEAQMNIGAFIPKASEYDSTTEENLKALRIEQRRGLRTAVSVLGGIPDANGYVTPVPTGYRLGQNPDLDVAIASTISNVPVKNRQKFILDAQRRFDAKMKAKTAPPRKADPAVRSLLEKYGVR